jgi:hypothetical protein
MAKQFKGAHMSNLTGLRRLVPAAGLCLAAALPALEPPATTVEFAPAVMAKMQDYGEDQRAPLADAILAAVAREAGRTRAMSGLEITVTVEDVAPTRPTRAQLAANPAISVTHSKSLGGAQLRAEVRDAHHTVLTVVEHSYFAPTLGLGSPSFNPWGDADRAIDQFAVKLAAACRDLPRG